MTWRSKKTLERPRWSKVRALYKGMGYSDYDLERPIIGLANTWSTLVPGHYNLRQVAEYVRQGVYQAGGHPGGVRGDRRLRRPSQRPRRHALHFALQGDHRRQRGDDG